MWEFLFNPSSWIVLVILVFLEVILGIDNILFLAILSGKLPKSQQKKARHLGLLFAMLFRLALLFSISWVLSLQRTWIYLQNELFSCHISGHNTIFLLGGLFLIYKSIEEIRYKITYSSRKGITLKKKTHGFWKIVVQIVFLDIVFSIDSLLTAIGLINLNNPPEGFGERGLLLIAIAIIITIVIILFFSEAVSSFIQYRPSLQILGLCFLMLVGIMLLLEAAQIGKCNLIGYDIKNIPRGYLYFAISFALIIELLNSKRIREPSNKDPTEHNSKKS